MSVKKRRVEVRKSGVSEETWDAGEEIDVRKLGVKDVTVRKWSVRKVNESEEIECRRREELGCEESV